MDLFGWVGYLGSYNALWEAEEKEQKKARGWGRRLRERRAEQSRALTIDLIPFFLFLSLARSGMEKVKELPREHPNPITTFLLASFPPPPDPLPFSVAYL